MSFGRNGGFGRSSRRSLAGSSSTGSSSVEVPGMGNEQYKAVEYRRQATSCLEVARRISLRDERERLLEMAEQFLALAKEAEAEERPLC